MKYLFFILPLLALVYVFIRMWYILPFSSLGKSFVVGLGVLIFASMILLFVAGLDNMPLKISTIFYEITTSWLFILLYLLMIFLLMDILRCCHVLPKEFLFNSIKGTCIVFGAVLLIFIYGNIHYYQKKKVNIALTTDKQIEKPLKIILISDLHLGYHNQRHTFAKWVDKLNKEQADLILIGGDIIDISTKPLFEQKVYEEFIRLNAPIYAC
ncbi:MAG: metallophosphoesterase [Bacteroidota bacterium]|nr:metallophosphoesterase [Bacteroidota bacterium]